MRGGPSVAKPRARPRSVSVQSELSQRIDEGVFPAGMRLPSEPLLATQLGVSRATLREALRSLESEGRLRRTWGSGTYVAERRRLANSLDMNFGVTEAIRAAGMEPGIQHGRHWLEPVSSGEAVRLGLEPGQDVLIVERVRTADGTPVVLSRDILPGWVVGTQAAVGDAMLQRSIYDVLEKDLGIVIDHGVASFRPVRADLTVARGANVIMMSKGMIRLAVDAFSPTTSLALLLSASANPGESRPAVIQIAEVEEAARLGADAVVLFTALGGETEAAMIRTLAGVGRESALLGVPLIAEAEFPTTYASVEELTERYGFEYLRRSVRLCAELGADIVKTNWPGDEDAFGRLVNAVKGIPMVLAGGSRVEDAELLRRMECAMQAGAIGCSVGRNIFMHRSPEAITRALSRVIRDRWPARKALAELEQKVGMAAAR